MTAALCATVGYGRSTPPNAVHLSGQFISDSAFGGAQASYRIGSSGTVTDQDGNTLESWLLSGPASAFEVRATSTSGTLSSGPTGWVSCSIDRTWAKVNNLMNNSVASVVIFVEMRAAANPTVILASASVTLSAESDNFN